MFYVMMNTISEDRIQYDYVAEFDSKSHAQSFYQRLQEAVANKKTIEDVNGKLTCYIWNTTGEPTPVKQSKLKMFGGAIKGFILKEK